MISVVPITSWPVPADARAAIMFGGSFDPPHRAHAALPSVVRSAWAAMSGIAEESIWLVYVPAARSPHKAVGPTASDADRMAMLRLALADERVARATIWTDELDRASAMPESYSVTTAERAHRSAAAAGQSITLRWLIGADQAVAFHRWREPRRLITLAEPLVMLRGGASGGAGGEVTELVRSLAAAGAWSPAELEAWRTRLIITPTRTESATAVREALSFGDDSAAAKMLTPGVARYIAERGLYRPSPPAAPPTPQ